MITTKELEAALHELESLFPDLGIILTVFDGAQGETIANRDDATTAKVITGLYINRVRVPLTSDTLQ